MIPRFKAINKHPYTLHTLHTSTCPRVYDHQSTAKGARRALAQGQAAQQRTVGEAELRRCHREHVQDRVIDPLVLAVVPRKGKKGGAMRPGAIGTLHERSIATETPVRVGVAERRDETLCHLDAVLTIALDTRQVERPAMAAAKALRVEEEARHGKPTHVLHRVHPAVHDGLALRAQECAQVIGHLICRHGVWKQNLNDRDHGHLCREQWRRK
jgi:hypothetical protein